MEIKRAFVIYFSAAFFCILIERAEVLEGQLKMADQMEMPKGVQV